MIARVMSVYFTHTASIAVRSLISWADSPAVSGAAVVGLGVAAELAVAGPVVRAMPAEVAAPLAESDTLPVEGTAAAEVEVVALRGSDPVTPALPLAAGELPAAAEPGAEVVGPGSG